MPDNDVSRQPTGDEEDFSALLERSAQMARPGEVVTGRVVSIGREYATIDIGYKSEGLVPMVELRDRDGNPTVREGDDVEVYFDVTDLETGVAVLSRKKAEQYKVWRDIENAFTGKGCVEGTIVGKVKGGLKVDIGVAAFLPGSHADIRPSRNLDRYIGQRGRFRGNVVVSRRDVLERERASMKEETLKVLEEGIILEGTVKNITDYGAFVDLGGLDGLLHITDMSWGRLSHPSEVMQVGERVKVVVLKYDPERERVSLGMKQIAPDPWGSVAERYFVGSRVSGKVVTLTEYGAFVELERGVEGLIHVSEMSWTKRISHPSKLLEVGAEVEVVVLDVDSANRRISLGLKQAVQNPWELARANHPVGSRIKGVVRSITDFGMFVEMEEGVDGLVHISDLHWTQKIRHPSELYKNGDEVEAVVLGVDVENERISLGIKQLTEDPWQAAARRYTSGSRVSGTVTSVTDFGVFVDIGDGIEGLIHVSQLSTERVDKPASLFKPGDSVEAAVVNVDTQDRRIALSIKMLHQVVEREEVDAYLQRERDAGRFSFDDILSRDLRLDRDDSEKESSTTADSDSLGSDDEPETS
jgi:small subunit ribosomal protein S1